MIPCLYRETEEQFSTNGIGKLCDALSCFVTEKRNGSYELKLGYPSASMRKTWWKETSSSQSLQSGRPHSPSGSIRSRLR